MALEGNPQTNIGISCSLIDFRYDLGYVKTTSLVEVIVGSQMINKGHSLGLCMMLLLRLYDVTILYEGLYKVYVSPS